jgi:hypothetical protein
MSERTLEMIDWGQRSVLPPIYFYEFFQCYVSDTLGRDIGLRRGSSSPTPNPRGAARESLWNAPGNEIAVRINYTKCRPCSRGVRLEFVDI